MTEIAEEEENTEEDTTAGKTLQDLHVYDFGLTDAQGAAVEYTDKVTYSVKSDSAADTDTDATDYVIYRVNEEEDSGEGAIVTLEPIEDSTGTVKLDGSGWMTEFSVKTEPVEQIAVAVYKTAAAETEEGSEEGDGTEEEENAGDVGISTFAVNVEGETGYIKLPKAETVDRYSYAPTNNLLIFDNIDGAAVTVLESNRGNSFLESKEINDNGQGEVEGMTRGDWSGSSGCRGAGSSMYSDMCAGSGDDYINGVAVRFQCSVDDGGTGTNSDGSTYSLYKYEYGYGWNDDDKNLTTTEMKVDLFYTNAAYYRGELVNAVAHISITPSKNRNESNYWYGSEDSSSYNEGYSGSYYPMFQASGSLYRGWVWQNVEQFHVSLEFYHQDDDDLSDPIVLGAGTQDYGDMTADYYVINSLNPERNTGKDTGNGHEYPARFIGPEYVLPTQDIQHAYIVGEYGVDSDGDGTLDITNITSNIRENYSSDNASGSFLQHAYNGSGSSTWTGEDYDNQESPYWPQNSVMIIPEASRSLDFTLGQMEIQPWYNGASGNASFTQASDVMWATISTTPFTQVRRPVNINVEKSWSENANLDEISSVEFQLWAVYNDSNGIIHEENIRQITVTGADNWEGTFSLVPDLEYYSEENGYINFRYEVREIVSYTNNTSTSSEDSDFPYQVTGTTSLGTLTRNESTVDDEYDVNEKFEITNTLASKGSVTVIKQDTLSGSMDGVTFQLQAADQSWNVIPEGSTGYYTATLTTGENGQSTGQVKFENLELGNYILTEIKTRPGYILLKDSVRVTIPTQDSYDLTYTITNGQSFDLPQTGGTSADRIMRTGMVLFATAAGALLYLNRKRRREQQKN